MTPSDRARHAIEMAVPKMEHTPVQPRGGGLVHAVAMTSTTTTCGREFRGWVATTKLVNCAKCKAAIFYPVRVRPRRRK